MFFRYATKLIFEKAFSLRVSGFAPIVISVLFFSFTTEVYSQDIDFSGKWQGILIQPFGTFTDNYAFWLDITQTGNAIKGSSRIEISETNYFALMKLKGERTATTLIFEEQKVTKGTKHPRKGWQWCIKSGVLTYNPQEKTLSGTWMGKINNTTLCNPGTVVLYRTNGDFNIEPPPPSNPNRDTTTVNDLKDLVEKGKSLLGKKIIIPNNIDPKLGNVLFDFDKSTIRPEAHSFLDQFVQLLNQRPTIRIKVSGHTDSFGNDEYNFKLSRARANSIVDYLVANGIHSNRLAAEGFGKSKPIASNDTESGRQENRRVEFEIVSE